ncbi:hypothetical protein NL108_018305 [Boleophthalmus pectinirostris]|nr:hypothetical protein NL108_018305 [Boleophthalmus pectinirostris]
MLDIFLMRVTVDSQNHRPLRRLERDKSSFVLLWWEGPRTETLVGGATYRDSGGRSHVQRLWWEGPRTETLVGGATYRDSGGRGHVQRLWWEGPRTETLVGGATYRDSGDTATLSTAQN